MPGDLQRQQECASTSAARLVEVDVRQRRVVRAAAGDQHWSTGSAARRRTARAGRSRSRRTRRCWPRVRGPARSRRSGLRAVMITSAPSARARRAVSSPMPALPPITTTVCPSSAGARSVSGSALHLSSFLHSWALLVVGFSGLHGTASSSLPVFSPANSLGRASGKARTHPR